MTRTATSTVSSRSARRCRPACCRQVAPSTYCRCKALERQPEKRSERTRRDAQLCHHIQRVWAESDRNYGAHKVWKQPGRESISAARCTTDETPGMTRRTARQALYYHDTRRGRPQATLGSRYYLCAHRVWLCLRGLCGRRLLPLHRRLASAQAQADGFNPGRA